MKIKAFFIFSIITLMVPTSCTLFIDEEDGFTNKKKEDLPVYTGHGYDEPETVKNEHGEVTYQFKQTTRTLFEDDDLTKFILKVDAYGYDIHEMFLDGATPKSLLPKERQILVSNNLNLFEYGMCAEVLSVDEKDGQYVVLCAHVPAEEAYEILNMKLTPDLNEYFTEFGYLDDDGNFVDLFSQGEMAEANGKKKVQEIAKDDKSFTFSLDPMFNLFKGALKKMEEKKEVTWKPNKDDNWDWRMFGNIKIGTPNIEWDLSPFNLTMSAGGSVTIGAELSGKLGMSKPWSKRFEVYQPKKPWVFPSCGLVIFPDISVDIFIDATLNGSLDFSATHYFGVGGDVVNQEQDPKHVTPPQIEEGKDNFSKATQWLAKNGFDFGGKIGANITPGIKVNIGLGLYSSYLLLTPQFILEFPIQMNMLDLHVSGGEPAYISMGTQAGLGFAVEAGGPALGSIITRIKEHYDRAKSFYTLTSDLTKAYEKNGTYEQWLSLAEYGDDWHDFFENDNWKKHGLTDDQKNAMYNNVMEGVYQKGNIQDMVKQKAEEKKKVKEAPDVTKNVERLNGEFNVVGSRDYILEVDPWKPEYFYWPIFKKYITPKMKDGTFKIGYEMDTNNKMYYRPQLQMEDLGILPVGDIYLGWALYDGQTFIRDFVRHKPGTSSNDPGFKPSPLAKGLETQSIYYDGKLRNPKFRPFFYQESDLSIVDGRYTVQDKNFLGLWDKYLANPLAFTLANPFMNIQAVTPVRAFVLRDANGNVMVDARGNVLYSAEVIVSVQVNGMSHIEEMGIRQNIRQENGTYKYEYIKMNKLDLWKNEQEFYLPIVEVNTLTPTLNLTPYIILKPGENMTDKDPTVTKDARTTHYDDYIQKIDLTPVLEGVSSK